MTTQDIEAIFQPLKDTGIFSDELIDEAIEDVIEEVL